MPNLQVYLICSSLVFWHIFNYSVSITINPHQNTTNMTPENKELNVTSRPSASPSYRSSLRLPVSLLLHRIHKREINPNQGSSWLKFVWRERQYNIPQMWLTNIRNLWAIDPAGGRDCFDAQVPYGAVYLFKTLLLDSLFPRIGKNQ